MLSDCLFLCHTRVYPMKVTQSNVSFEDCVVISCIIWRLCLTQLYHLKIVSYSVVSSEDCVLLSCIIWRLDHNSVIPSEFMPHSVVSFEKCIILQSMMKVVSYCNTWLVCQRWTFIFVGGIILQCCELKHSDVYCNLKMFANIKLFHSVPYISSNLPAKT